MKALKNGDAYIPPPKNIDEKKALRNKIVKTAKIILTTV
jgi:hypothetical protein